MLLCEEDNFQTAPEEMRCALSLELSDKVPLGYAKPQEDCFEIITPDGKCTKMFNWTDEEWERFSLDNFMNTKDDEDVD